MGLLRGSLNITCFALENLTFNFTELNQFIKTHAFKDIENTSAAQSSGFVSVDDFMDTSFAYEVYNLNPYIVLGVRQDKKIISGKLLNKYYRMEIKKARTAEPEKRIDRATRVMLKEKAKLQLLMQTPSAPKTWEIILNSKQKHLIILSANDSEIGIATDLLSRCMHFTMLPYSPLRKINIDLYGGEHDSRAQQEFLTWLWYLADTMTGFKIDGLECYVEIAGRITLSPNMGIAGTTVSVAGNDDNLYEARKALEYGKLVTAIKIKYVCNDTSYTLTLDAKTLQPRGVILPCVEQSAESSLDSDALTLERIFLIERLLEIHNGFITGFIEMHQGKGKMLELFNLWKRLPISGISILAENPLKNSD